MNPPQTHGEPDAVLTPPTSPEQYLSLVFNSAANMMALFQVGAASSLRLISFNRAYLSVVRAAGYPLESGDLIGRTIDDLFSHVFKFDGDDRKRHLDRYGEVLATNRPVSYEEIHDTPNGRYYGETTLSPVPAPDGACAFVLFSSTDVTERRRAEELRRQLEGQLQQAQKLQALGTLAGGIAHDFSNILTAMLGNAQLLLLDLPPGSPMAGCAQQIVDGSHRARDLVQQIRTFSRQQRERAAAQQHGKGQEHILFVDDEEAVRQLGKPILERFGYRVTLLSDGPAVLEWLRQHPGDADAIVSDLTMPEMSGIELAREVERLEPGLPFVIMTGYGESSEVRSLNPQQLLAKPFTLDELAKAVRTALSRAK